MAIKRITVSVPEEIATRIKEAAGATPVSAWLTKLVEERLDAAELDRFWDDFVRDVRPDRKAQRQAEAILARLANRKRRRREPAPSGV